MFAARHLKGTNFVNIWRGTFEPAAALIGAPDFLLPGIDSATYAGRKSTGFPQEILDPKTI